MACRFPNPVPSGTRVPRWALIDVTVRCYVFFNGNIFTAPSTGSLRTIGTQTSLLQSEVRILSLPSLTINVSHPRPVSRLPRASSWRNPPFWRHRFCIRHPHPHRCYIVCIVTLWLLFVDRDPHPFTHTEKQFKHGRHRGRCRGWRRGDNRPRSYRNRIVHATAQFRGACPRRPAGCRCISAAHG